MVATEYMKVVNNLIAETQWGKRRVINLISKTGEKGAVWAKDLDSLTHIRPNQTVEVIRGAKGSLTILERSATPDKVGSATPQDPPRNVNGNGISELHSSHSRNEALGEPLERVVEDLIHDVPMLSDLDKKKVAAFIDQQAKLYRYTVDTVAKQFPELVGVDDRGIRSIALSLLINTNHMINRNL